MSDGFSLACMLMISRVATGARGGGGGRGCEGGWFVLCVIM